MSAYKWIRTNEMVKRLADNANIPCVVGNSDFAKFQEYVASGGQVDAADPLPLPTDYSNLDNLDKTLRAIGLLIAQYTGKTPAQVKQDFVAKYNSLP